MKLLFAADLVPTKTSEQLFIDKDFKTLFGDIKEIVNKYDRFIVNNEYALTNEEQGIVIAHYVDCEAHEDVLRHLFRTWHLTEKY